MTPVLLALRRRSIMGLWERLRSRIGRAYPAYVRPSRRLPKVEPIRHLAELNGHIGEWVAVKNGRVKAAAPTSRKLAEELHKRNIQGATIQFVAPTSKGERVGLG
jgi:hypothetical protein